MRGVPFVAAIALAGCTATAQTTASEPAEPSADFIRTTLVVRDIEKSLALYRDTIGLVLTGDREIGTNNISAPSTGAPGARGRIAMLRGPDDSRGMLGLIQWTDPPMPDPGPYEARLAPGSAVFVIRVQDATTACTGAEAIHGVTVTSPLTERVFGGGQIRALTCTLFDPDGNLIELSQRITE